ncbi:hypothetical protein [Paucisalibacillus globulus]|nr:hypothetical protein [Paucisalibacillus globulus]
MYNLHFALLQECFPNYQVKSGDTLLVFFEINGHKEKLIQKIGG